MASSSWALELQGARVSLGGGAIRGGKNSPPCLSLKPPQNQRRRTQARCLLTAAQAPANVGLEPSFSQGQRAAFRKEEGNKRREPITADKLDEWTRESVGEIVSHIGEAPFLVHIFPGRGGSRDVSLERESASQDTWPHIKKRWHQGSRTPTPTPDGVILVEELKDDDNEGEGREGAEEEEVAPMGNCGPDPTGPRTWGLVVQGRGLDCVACYILNTCRVRSSVGFCTHFCLVRAKCFGDPAELQLRQAWLQGR